MVPVTFRALMHVQFTLKRTSSTVISVRGEYHVRIRILLGGHNFFEADLLNKLYILVTARHISLQTSIGQGPQQLQLDS